MQNSETSRYESLINQLHSDCEALTCAQVTKSFCDSSFTEYGIYYTMRTKKISSIWNIIINNFHFETKQLYSSYRVCEHYSIISPASIEIHKFKLNSNCSWINRAYTTQIMRLYNKRSSAHDKTYIRFVWSNTTFWCRHTLLDRKWVKGCRGLSRTLVQRNTDFRCR